MISNHTTPEVRTCEEDLQKIEATLNKDYPAWKTILVQAKGTVERAE